jgi:hypothetical protein
MVNTLFEIHYVEEETPFYQLQNLPVFKLKIEAFEYSNEAIDTGVEAIDKFEEVFGSRTRLSVSDINGTFLVGDEIEQTISNSPQITVKGEIAEFVNDTTWDIVGISASDGSDTTFTLGDISNLNSIPPSTATISSPASTHTPIDENDRSAQNEDFDLIGDNFIDFSELNPFGDVRLP